MTTLRRWNGSAWEDALALPGNMVTTDSAQTIAGAKTFSVAPVVPDSSFAISAITGLQTSLDSKYSAANPPPAGTAPTNMVTTDTVQTITSGKTIISGTLPALAVMGGATGTPGTAAMAMGRQNGVIDAWFGTPNTTKFFSDDVAGDFSIRANTATGSIRLGYGTSNASAAALVINSGGVAATGIFWASALATTGYTGTSTKLAVLGTGTTQVTSVIKMVASQTADMTQWQNSSGTVLAKINNIGSFYGRAAGLTAAAATDTSLVIASYAAQTTPSAIIQVGAGQTGNQFEFRSSAGAVLSRVGPDGAIYDNGNRVYSASNPPPATDLSTYATTSYVDNRFTTLTGAAPAALDTLNELAAALGNDANFASTVTTNLASKVSLAGTENITGAKTFNGPGLLKLGPGTNNNTFMEFYARTASPTVRSAYLGYANPGDTGFTFDNSEGDFFFTKNVGVTGTVSASVGVYDSGNRVYSAGNKVPLTGLSATGTANTTTFLRGDNTWATLPAAPVTSVAGRTGAVVLTTADIGGYVAPAVSSVAGRTGAVTLTTADIGGYVAPPVSSVNGRTGAVTGLAEGNAVVDLTTAQTIAGVKTFSAIPVVPNGSFGIAKLSVTGTPSATTYLRGDGSWATVAAGGTTVYEQPDPDPAWVAGTLWVDTDEVAIANVSYIVEPYTFSVTGNLSIATGKSRVYCETSYVIESVRASVNTAPTGAAVIVDVSLNGTSIFGNQAARPTITPGSNTAISGTPTTVNVFTGQYLTVDVDQVGSTVAGADLTVVIRLRRV